MTQEEIKEQVKLILEDCFFTDWFWNGEEEYPEQVFDTDQATTRITEFIQTLGA